MEVQRDAVGDDDDVDTDKGGSVHIQSDAGDTDGISSVLLAMFAWASPSIMNIFRSTAVAARCNNRHHLSSLAGEDIRGRLSRPMDTIKSMTGGIPFRPIRSHVPEHKTDTELRPIVGVLRGWYSFIARIVRLSENYDGTRLSGDEIRRLVSDSVVMDSEIVDDLENGDPVLFVTRLLQMFNVERTMITKVQKLTRVVPRQKGSIFPDTMLATWRPLPGTTDPRIMLALISEDRYSYPILIADVDISGLHAVDIINRRLAYTRGPTTEVIGLPGHISETAIGRFLRGQGCSFESRMEGNKAHGGIYTTETVLNPESLPFLWVFFDRSELADTIRVDLSEPSVYVGERLMRIKALILADEKEQVVVLVASEPYGTWLCSDERSPVSVMVGNPSGGDVAMTYIEQRLSGIFLVPL